MQIDQITIALRPRSTWEAIDLGFGLTRRWWMSLLFCWLLLALPVFVICGVVFYDNPFIASSIFWWGKPLYEQLPLFFISRAIFNQAPDRKEIIKELPRRSTRQLIANLTWRRFSMNRSYTAPVAQLEGLKGSARRQRLQVLSETRNVGSWLTIVCMHFEAILYLSLILLVWMLVPFDVDFIQWINDHENNAKWGINIAYFLGVAVIAPFYVVSGFSLYLNRRTHLEGWDIELTFKRIRERLAKRKIHTVAAVLMLGIASLVANFSMISNAAAAQKDDDAAASEQASLDLVSRDKAKEIIDSVLENKDFGEKKQITTWKLKKSFDFKEEKNEDINVGALAQLLAMVANISYYLIWFFVALLAVWVIYQFPKWKNALQFSSNKSAKSPKPQQGMVFGLEITEESLPDNIAEEAWRLFANNQPRLALSLLYRGSLAVLINQYGIIVKDSDTEGECAQQVEHHQAQLAVFFSMLTRAWVYMAYGHQAPSADEMKQLCDGWNKHFLEGAV